MEEMTFGERLTERMRKAGFDRTLVAYMMGCTPEQVTKWQQCRFSPGAQIVIRLARVLWCWPWELDTHLGTAWYYGGL